MVVLYQGKFSILLVQALSQEYPDWILCWVKEYITTLWNEITLLNIIFLSLFYFSAISKYNHPLNLSHLI